MMVVRINYLLTGKNNFLLSFNRSLLKVGVVDYPVVRSYYRVFRIPRNTVIWFC